MRWSQIAGSVDRMGRWRRIF